MWSQQQRLTLTYPTCFTSGVAVPTNTRPACR
jgi:hypothetical protein